MGEMCAGRVRCWCLVSHFEYTVCRAVEDRQTDGQIPRDIGHLPLWMRPPSNRKAHICGDLAHGSFYIKNNIAKHYKIYGKLSSLQSSVRLTGES